MPPELHRCALVVVALVLSACSEAGTEVSGPPELLALGVAPLELSPPFSPWIHDYTIRCAPGPNSVFVTTQPGPGAIATVRMPRAPTSVEPDRVTLDVLEGDALVIDVAGGPARQSYWVRCLPHDFPAIRVSKHAGAGTPQPGWYLLGNATTSYGESGFAIVLDANGTPVWYRRVAASGVFDVDRWPDGSVSYIANLGYYGSDPSARYVVQTLEPWQSRSIRAVGSPTDEHELRILPNGDALIFSYQNVEHVDLEGLGSYGKNETMVDCLVQEIDAAGGLVWQWRASDHVDPVRESTGPESLPVGGEDVADVFHFNSIDVDAGGNLLLSARNTDALFYVDRANGRVLWKLGGTPYSKDGAQLVRVVGDPETAFSRQHDARLQPGGVSVFDDHTALPGVARGVQYSVDLDASTAKVVWEYRGVRSALAMGSFRRYGEGSNVIAWGLSSAPSAFAGAFTEVDDAGRDRFDVAFVEGDATYRVVKVPIEDLDIDVLRATAGRP